MKLLIINNNAFYTNGDALCVFRTTGEFAVELKELGNEVEMFQTKINFGSEICNYDLLNKGIKITTVHRYKSKIFTYIEGYLKGIWRIWHNDFIYIYFPGNYMYLAFFARIFGRKYGLNIRGQKGIKKLISIILYKFAEVVFTVSPDFTALVTSVGGKGYDKKPTISYTHSDIVSKRTYSTKEAYNILFLGRIDKDKGLFELLESIHRLKYETGYKFLLKIVGDGEDLSKLKLKASELNIIDCVEFCGAISNISQIMQIYKLADIYILPSYHEGFPRTLYEAMIFGTPIITTFVGGISGIMKDGYNCYRIEPKSVDSIFNKLLFVMTNYEQVKEIAKNGREMVSNIIRPDRPNHAQHLHKLLNSK